VRLIVARRRSRQAESFGAIECPDHDQVRKAFYIGEASFKFSQYLENPLGLVLRA
jgi:hypothetical protein